MYLRIQQCVLAALATAILFGPSHAATPAKDQKSWTTPRTPDGQPDLQGYWSNGSYIPLERPKELGTKEFYTESEAAAVEKKKIEEDHSQAANDIHYDNVIWQGEKYAKGAPNLRTSIVFDPPDGRIPPLSPEGQKHAVELAALARDRAAAISAETRNLAERCVTWGADGPPMLGSTYNANFQIVQNADSVVILTEMIHSARTIWLDGRPHVAANIRELGGDSRGHWEGDTLVVDTTNFTNETNFRGPPATARQDIFSSPRLHVTERFTRVGDGTIVYRFTMDDPGTWTKPWSGEMLMEKTKGPIFEYACHEGNYGLVDILEGARRAEAKAQKKSN
ncbi:MAG: hypothetical protein ACLPWF_23825 [Bryobacteraceae bacterium]